jgi:hypothetical protein
VDLDLPPDEGAAMEKRGSGWWDHAEDIIDDCFSATLRFLELLVLWLAFGLAAGAGFAIATAWIRFIFTSGGR